MPNELSLKLARNYCANVVSVARGRTGPLRPLFFSWYATMRCNFQCAYCTFVQEGLTRGVGPELDTGEALRLLATIRRESTALYVTGGEPLLRADLPRLLSAARHELRFRSVSLNTNMSLIDSCMEILPLVTNLVASLDMLDEESYAPVLGTSAGTVARVKRNIVACAALQRRHGFRMSVNCVVTPATIGQARQVMDFCFRSGLRFAVAPGELVGGRVDERLRGNPEYRALLDDIIRAKRDGRPVFGSLAYLRAIRDFEPFVCLPTLTPHVSARGELFYPCEPLQAVAVSLLEVPDYREALRLGRERCGPLPACRDRCHKACYIEPGLFVRSPAALFREYFP